MNVEGLGVKGRLVVVLALISATIGCVTRQAPPVAPKPLQRYEYTQPQMGMSFRMVVYAPDRSTASNAVVAAFSRIAELNGIMSDYERESELSRLSLTSGSGKEVPISPDLWRVLRHAQILADESQGAFDVTVGPLVNQWRRARRQKEFPKETNLITARAAVGYQHLRLDSKRHTARLEVPNMRLDLGAIAKGFAVDAALQRLGQLGIRSALVAGAGDLAVSDPPPGTPGWRIELAPLDVTNAPPTRFVVLKNQALATSGDVFQYVEIEGRRYSHIVDPRTGIGLTDHSLVTVIATNCMTADALSTAVSVLGPTEAIPFLRRQRNVEARIVRVLGTGVEQFETPGFRRFDAP